MDTNKIRILEYEPSERDIKKALVYSNIDKFIETAKADPKTAVNITTILISLLASMANLGTQEP